MTNQNAIGGTAATEPMTLVCRPGRRRPCRRIRRKWAKKMILLANSYAMVLDAAEKLAATMKRSEAAFRTFLTVYSVKKQEIP